MKKILLILFASIGVQQLAAQDEDYAITMSYPVGFPVGSMHNFIQQTSFLGLSAEFTKRTGTNVDIVFEVGWHTFYSRSDEKTFTDGTVSISGVQDRYTNVAPVLLGFKYTVPTETKIKPYFAFGMGAMYSERRREISRYPIETDTWQFLMRPEVGIIYKTDFDISPLIGVKYYGSFGNQDLSGQSFLSISVGLRISII